MWGSLRLAPNKPGCLDGISDSLIGWLLKYCVQSASNGLGRLVSILTNVDNQINERQGYYGEHVSNINKMIEMLVTSRKDVMHIYC